MKKVTFILLAGVGTSNEAIRVPPIYIHSSMFDKTIVSTLFSNGYSDHFELCGAMYKFLSTGVLEYSKTVYSTARTASNEYSKITILFFSY